MLKRLQDRDETQRQLIDHILGVLAIANRPLNAWEVCGAIAFQNGQSSLTSETRPPPSIIDSCKPFIEETKQGTIKWIHSSAREYGDICGLVSEADASTATCCLNQVDPLYSISRLKLILHRLAFGV